MAEVGMETTKQSQASTVSNQQLSVPGQWASSAVTGSLGRATKPQDRNTTVKLTALQGEFMVEASTINAVTAPSLLLMLTKFASSAHVQLVAELHS